MKTFRTSVAFLLGTMMLALMPVVHAQETIPEETLQLPLGSVFEIMTSPRGSEVQLGWILTKDKTFVKAERGLVFRTRFSEEGTYALLGEIRDKDNAIVETRRFVIEVQADEIDLDTGTGAVIQKMLETNPPLLASGKIVVPAGKQVIRFTPTTLDATPVILDLSKTLDSNGDGNSENDSDTLETFFSSNGTALHVWFPASATETIIATNGATNLRMTLVNGTEGTVVTDNGSIVVSEIAEGVYQFETSGGSDASLYTWTFGDGAVSFLASPTHRYQVSGDYDVSVEARDATTAELVHSAQTSVSVTLTEAPVVPQPLEPSENPDSQDGDSGFSSSTLWFILKILGGFLLSLLVGTGITFVISKLRGGSSLQQKIAEAEKRVTGKDPSSIIEVPTTMEIKPAEDEQEPEEKSAEPQSEPKNDSSEAPQPTEPSAPALEPEPVSEVYTESESQGAGPTPDWLKESSETVVPTPVQEVAPPPEPVAEPTAPMQAPEPTPVPTPEPIPDSTPEPEPFPEPAPLQETMPAPVSESVPTPQIEVPAPEPEPSPEPAPQPEPFPTSVPEMVENPEPQETVSDEESTAKSIAEEDVPVQEDIEDEEDVSDPSIDAALTPEEKEKERKRKKRQRYRANKRRREQEAKLDAEPDSASAPDVSPQSQEVPLSEAQTTPVSTAQKPVQEYDIPPAEDDDNEPIAIVKAESLDEQDVPQNTEDQNQ